MWSYYRYLLLCGESDEWDSYSSSSSLSPERVVKRICFDQPEDSDSNATYVPELENESNSSSDGLTILHVLNEDCMRMIFDYVPLRLLMQTETVSQKWHSVVLQYLKGIRICLRNSEYINWWYEHPMKSRIMYLPYYELTNELVEKLGRNIVGAYTTESTVLDSLVEYCPDLEDLKVIRPESDDIFLDQPCCYKLKKLKRVSFQVIMDFDDEIMVEFITSPVLEEIVVVYSKRITGRFIKKLKSRLQALKIDSCRKLNVGNLASAAKPNGGLSELTKLGLNRNPTNNMKNVYKLIERTTKLECLTLEAYEYPTEVGSLVSAISKLSRLTHLSLVKNINVYDDWLEPIGRGCKALRCLNIGGCKNVSEMGVRAFCRTEAATNITRLDVSCNGYMTDEDVALCIRCCPKLEYLAVAGGKRMTNDGVVTAAAAAAAATRGPRLRLRLNRTIFDPDFIEYERIEHANGFKSLYLDRSRVEAPDFWDLHYKEKNGTAGISGYDLCYCDY